MDDNTRQKSHKKFFFILYFFKQINFLPFINDFNVSNQIFYFMSAAPSFLMGLEAYFRVILQKREMSDLQQQYCSL